jgi:hypothetical protein
MPPATANPSRRDATLTPSPKEIGALHDDVPEVEQDPVLLGQVAIARDHPLLKCDGAADGVDDAAEFDQKPVPPTI